MAASSEDHSYHNSGEVYSEEVSAVPAPRVSERHSAHKGKDCSCHQKPCHCRPGKWVEERKVKKCHEEKKCHMEKRCRTVVKYRKVKVCVKETRFRRVEKCKTVTNCHCSRQCQWIDIKVCPKGNSKKDCLRKKCCRPGEWVVAKKEKVCHDKKFCTPQKISYYVNEPYQVDVEVEVEEPYFVKEEYEEEKCVCEPVCHWITEPVHHPHHPK